MDLKFTPDQRALRDEIRAFLSQAIPPALRENTLNGAKLSKAEHVEWQQILRARGWLTPSWSSAWGGPGWGPVERSIFDEEANLAGMPRANVPGIDLLGPVIIEFGTEEQKARFLPRIQSSEHFWCQGFSEPGAGSDLANLSMRAVRDGDHYVVNGTKLWTSHAQMSNWIFCLVRTSIESKKQAGISFLLIPMDQTGVEVSPIITLGGVHAVNQVTIDDVRVPTDNLIGGEGQAWEITRFLLGHERLVGANIGPSTKFLADLKRLASSNSLGDDSNFRDRLAGLEIELMALRYTAYRVMADEMAGRAPGPEVSVLKLKGAQVHQDLAELLMDTVGPMTGIDPLSLTDRGSDVIPADEAYLSQIYMDRRKVSIYGGASEIQKNIIAQRILRV